MRFTDYEINKTNGIWSDERVEFLIECASLVYICDTLIGQLLGGNSLWHSHLTKRKTLRRGLCEGRLLYSRSNPGTLPTVQRFCALYRVSRFDVPSL